MFSSYRYHLPENQVAHCSEWAGAFQCFRFAAVLTGALAGAEKGCWQGAPAAIETLNFRPFCTGLKKPVFIAVKANGEHFPQNLHTSYPQ